MEDDERNMLELAARDRNQTSRLGCQAKIERDGVCEVAITEESFQEYLDNEPDDRERAIALWLKPS